MYSFHRKAITCVKSKAKVEAKMPLYKFSRANAT
jgi:hypothetical protein